MSVWDNIIEVIKILGLPVVLLVMIVIASLLMVKWRLKKVKFSECFDLACKRLDAGMVGFVPDTEETTKNLQENPALDIRFANLETRLGAIYSLMEELKEHVCWLEERIKMQSIEFNKDRERNMGFHERIYKAHGQGREIAELAQEFGRGKGEIELILNLKKLRAGIRNYDL